MPEALDDEYPILLLTGRGTANRWQTQMRTSKSSVLRKLYPNEPYVEIHPEDAQAIGVGNGEMVRVKSRRGQVIVAACVSPTVNRGQAFMPMHYAATNQLTLRHFDKHSRKPSYKNSAVRVESVTNIRDRVHSRYRGTQCSDGAS